MSGTELESDQAGHENIIQELAVALVLHWRNETARTEAKARVCSLITGWVAGVQADLQREERRTQAVNAEANQEQTNTEDKIFLFRYVY